jgi:hypothetical protein
MQNIWIQILLDRGEYIFELILFLRLLLLYLSIFRFLFSPWTVIMSQLYHLSMLLHWFQTRYTFITDPCSNCHTNFVFQVSLSVWPGYISPGCVKFRRIDTILWNATTFVSGTYQEFSVSHVIIIRYFCVMTWNIIKLNIPCYF